MKNENSIETFRDIRGYALRDMIHNKPSCMNGDVRVRRYRVTVEEIDEPTSVLCERLQSLWDNTTNWHHSNPLSIAAKKLGYTLKGNMGNKATKDCM